MSSFNSSEMEDQLTMVFQGIMEEAMSMLQAEEVVAAAASSSTQGPKRHRRYVNRNHEATHFRLRHDYFVNTRAKVSYVEDSLTMHYA
jgi:hypothetical protein